MIRYEFQHCHENEADYFSIELCSYSMDIEENFIELFLKDGWK